MTQTRLLWGSKTFHAADLGISGGGSVSPAQPTMMVITDGKSDELKVVDALPGYAKEADIVDKRSSSSGGKLSSGVGFTNSGGEGQWEASVVLYSANTSVSLSMQVNSR